ncbi:hypothetical protein KIW84_040680 [Lathyrus oleraceus]|uniref:Uncharacterized protein n=1 Tax=Pisum sativum TaxID=3888 RepID=A0A9D4X7Q7_PEA|nr:hypothetical protein KIW84_040680 [Pisum sativum]
MVSKPIEYNDPTPSPNFEFPAFEVEEGSDEEVSDELSRFLEHEEKAIQSFEELSLKPECPPVKQKLRRTHPDMAVKIKEEVQK